MKKLISNIWESIGLVLIITIFAIIFTLLYIKDIPVKLRCYLSPKYKLYYEEKCKEEAKIAKKKLDDATKDRGWAFQDLS